MSNAKRRGGAAKGSEPPNMDDNRGTDGCCPAGSQDAASSTDKVARDITVNGRKRGRTARGGDPGKRSSTPSGVRDTANQGIDDSATRVHSGHVSEDLRDASQDGWSFFDALMRTDEEFRILVGALTTLYAVRKRHVQGIDARSYKAAKEKLVTFAATTTPWAVRGTEGDRRWSRGPLHEDDSFQGRTGSRTVERLGRQRGGVRGGCPNCGDAKPVAVFRTRTGVQCPSCARRVQKQEPEKETVVTPEAIEELMK